MPSFEELQAKTTPRRETVPVLLDAGLLAEHAELEESLRAAIQTDAIENREPESPALAERLVELEERIGKASDLFALESIGATRWYELLSDNPPTDEQRRLRLTENWRTFRPAALAETCRDPELTVDQAAWFMEHLPAGEWEKLWLGVYKVNVGAVGDRPKSRLVSAVLPQSRQSSDTPASEGSLEEPSSAASGEPSPSTSTTTTPAG